MNETESKSLADIPLSRIVTNPNQPRKKFRAETIQRLADSIKEVGLKEPLIVMRLEGDSYELIAGERRLRALAFLGRETAECIVRSEDPNPELSSLAENCCREDLNPVDQAVYFQMLRKNGKTLEEVGRVTGHTISTILNRIKLLELPKEVLEMVRDGNLPQVSALTLAQYRGPKGKLIRMAHDLAEGRDAFTVGARELGQTAHGIKLTVRKLPKSPAGILGRILDFYGWRANTAIPLAKAFLDLPSGDQKEACRALTESSRRNLLTRLESLSILAKELHSVISLHEGWDASENSALGKQEPKEPPARIPLPDPEKPVEQVPPSSKPKKVAKKSVKTTSPPRTNKKAEASPSENKAPIKPNLGNLQVLPPKAKVFLWCMAYDRNERVSPDISVASLSRRIYGDAELNGTDVESRALQTLVVTKERWGLGPNSHDPTEDEFRRIVANVRHDLNCRRFEDLLGFLRGSRVRDPIALSRIS